MRNHHHHHRSSRLLLRTIICLGLVATSQFHSGLAQIFDCEKYRHACEPCGEQTIACVGAHFTRIFIFSAFLRHLNLSHNMITEIPSNVFNHLSLLLSLDLGHNKLSKLETFTFAGTGNLLELNLAHNRIAHIEKNAFFNLLELRRLRLEGNRLRQLDADVFADMPALNQLNLINWFDDQNDESGGDDRPLLCRCDSHIRRMWKLEKNFIFCSNFEDELIKNKSGESWNPNRRSAIEGKQITDTKQLCSIIIERLSFVWRISNSTPEVQQEDLKRIIAKSRIATSISTTTTSTTTTILPPLPRRPVRIQASMITAENVTEKSSILNENSSSRSSIDSKDAPILIESPESMIRVKPGSSLEWKCSAIGNPSPSFKWLKRRIDSNGDRTETLSQNNALRLQSITADDEAIYECVARNAAGIASKEVHLHVIGGAKSDRWSRMTKTEFDGMVQSTNRIIDYDVWRRGKQSAIRNMTQFVDRIRVLVRESDDRKNDSNGERSFRASPIAEPDWLTPAEQMVMSNFTGCVGGANAQVLDCARHIRFRTSTGVCNNVRRRPLWGSQMTPFKRLLPARYEDGLMKPVGWFAATPARYHGYRLPSARLITDRLLSAGRLTPDPRHNHMLMLFGQFLDHDLSFTSPSRSWNIIENSVIDCGRMCDRDAIIEPCFSIVRTTNLRNSRCIELIRSAEMCGTGLTSIVHRKFIARQQVNQLTAFIDASNIYGSNDDIAQYLRDLNSNDGRMKTTRIGDRSYLPVSDESFPIDCQLQPDSSFMDCFLAGDHRANEHIGLLVLHNVWLRQHNRLAGKFALLRPDWSGERIYQETRKIIGAQLQVITYRDWIPLVIGSEGMRLLGEYRGYNDTIDPSIANAFSTAAMRFGHTLVNVDLIQHHHQKPQRRGQHIAAKSDMRLRRLFFASHLLFRGNVTDRIMRGMMATPLKKPIPEQAINRELTEHLFELSREAPLDLASINVQRGRDHALPSYARWRKFCGLPSAVNHSFESFSGEIRSAEIRRKLEQLYGHPDNVDLWVGAIMENAESDAKVGATFRCLLVDQFGRLRDGDRFFYKNPAIFTPKQLIELEKTSLSQVICVNGDDDQSDIYPQAFVRPERQPTSAVACGSLPDIDLTAWLIDSQNDQINDDDDDDQQ